MFWIPYLCLCCRHVLQPLCAATVKNKNCYYIHHVYRCLCGRLHIEDVKVMLFSHLNAWGVGRGTRRSWCHDNSGINSRKSPRGRCLLRGANYPTHRVKVRRRMNKHAFERDRKKRHITDSGFNLKSQCCLWFWWVRGFIWRMVHQTFVTFLFIIVLPLLREWAHVLV